MRGKQLENISYNHEYFETLRAQVKNLSNLGLIGLPTKKFEETRICESKTVVKSFSDIMKEDNTPYQLKLDIFVYKTNCYAFGTSVIY